MSRTPEQTMSDSHELRNPMGQPRGSASEASDQIVPAEPPGGRELAGVRQPVAADGSQSPELESLRSALEDACWLARWKREEVIVELCPSWLPGMLEALVRIHGDEPSSETAEHLETIIRRLSA